MSYYGPWYGTFEPVASFDNRMADRFGLSLDGVKKVRLSLLGGGWSAYQASLANIKFDVFIRTRRLAARSGRDDAQAHDVACRRVAKID